MPEASYIDALVRDMKYAADETAGRSPVSVFFGGGTPSLVSAHAVQRLLDSLRENFGSSDGMEITLEANPGASDSDRFSGYLEAGVNRLSIGVQSFSDTSLRRIGRIHDAETAARAIANAQVCGFDNINLDLMYGLPGQSVTDALQDVKKAISANPSHISWYQLTIEPNTVFYSHRPGLPGEESLWEMYTQGAAMLEESGYQQYEVSAWCRDGRECRHNRNYWEFGDYAGLGAGAHGKITAARTGRQTRITRHRIPGRYMQLAGTAAVETARTTLTEQDLLFEFMLNALRLKDGFSTDLLHERTGIEPADAGPVLEAACADGMLQIRNNRIVSTGTGYRFLDNLTARFLPATNTMSADHSTTR